MSLDPSSGLPTPGVPSIHGADSVHAALHDHTSLHSAHVAAHDVHRRSFALRRSPHRHVHVCEDPTCVASTGSPAAVLAVGIVGFLLVALLALYGFSQVNAGPEFPFEPADSTDATCTTNGVPVDCPPFP